MPVTIEISLDETATLPIDSDRRDTRTRLPEESKSGCWGCHLYSFCVNELCVNPYRADNSCYIPEDPVK